MTGDSARVWPRSAPPEADKPRILGVPSSTDSDGSIYSVGYEGRSIDEFIEVLVTNRVEVVVDVRLNAISRKRGFSKTALTTALADAAIAYQHERDLGNPKDNRDAFRSGLQSARTRYRRHLQNGATPSLQTVVELARKHRVALLCFEHDHSTCHRSCITERMQESWPQLDVFRL